MKTSFQTLAKTVSGAAVLAAGMSTESLAARPDSQRIARLEARLAKLSADLQSAREDERARLAADLHDEFGALLTAARLALARAEAWLPADAPAACRTALTQSDDALGALGCASRRLTTALHEPCLDHGLSAALARWVDAFAAQTQLLIRLVCPTDDARLAALPHDVAVTLFRIAQEALNNAAKHAAASEIEVVVAVGPRYLTLSVIDDGRGLPLGAARRGRRRTGDQDDGGFGLQGMRARCRACGGTLRVASTPGAGTALRARLPWPA